MLFTKPVNVRYTGRDNDVASHRKVYKSSQDSQSLSVSI